MRTVELINRRRTSPTRRRGAEMPRVAFIMSQFPEMHETFILRELVALDDAGLDFVIFSLKPCRDAVVQSGAKRFAERTFYPWSGGGAALPGRFSQAARCHGCASLSSPPT